MKNKSGYNINFRRNITMKELEQGMEEYLSKDNPNAKTFSPFIENTRWKDEEGNKYSSWKIGENLHTGDGGAEMFMKAMQEAGEKILKNGK